MSNGEAISIPLELPAAKNVPRETVRSSAETPRGIFLSTLALLSSLYLAKFLALRLLNRRARVQLAGSFGDLAVLPERLCLLAISIEKGGSPFAPSQTVDLLVRHLPSRMLPTELLIDLRVALLKDLRSCYLSEEIPLSERFDFPGVTAFSLTSFGNTSFDQTRPK